MAAKLIMLKGLPASGKSTWATDRVLSSMMSNDDASQWWHRVNKDTIRLQIGEPWSPALEKKVLLVRDGVINGALNGGGTIIVDDTNLDPKHEAALRVIAERHGAAFEIEESFLTADLDDCIARDRLRVGTARVGEKVIREMAERYLQPARLIKRAAGTQLFLDLDGVFADFDGFIEKELGIVNNRENEDPNFWDKARAYPGRLYADMAPIDYAKRLFAALAPYDPIILTGCPWSLPTAADDKREWVKRHLDPNVRVICCKSRNKFRYALPGDILLDDWTKYQGIWEEMGGIFVHHVDPDDSIAKIKRLLGTP